MRYKVKIEFIPDTMLDGLDVSFLNRSKVPPIVEPCKTRQQAKKIAKDFNDDTVKSIIIEDTLTNKLTQIKP